MDRGTLRSFLSRNRRNLILLLSMSFIYLFSYFQRMAIPGTIFDLLQSDFMLSASGVSSLGAVFLYVYGAMQVPTGILVDRFGGTRVLAVGGFFLVVGSFLFPLSHGLPLLYATRALIGIGSSLIYISILKEINELFAPRQFAVVVGIVVFIGYCGGLLGTLPFERASDAWGWRSTLIGLAIACLFFFLIFMVVSIRSRQSARRRPSKSSSLAPLSAVFKNAAGYPILLGYPIQFAIYFVIQGPIGKKMLQDTTGISSAWAAGITFIMMVISILCASTSGLVSRLAGDRRKPIIIAAGGIFLTAIVGSLFGLFFSLSPTFMAICFIVLAWSTLGGIINVSAFKEVNVSRNAGTAVGVLNCCTYLLIAVLSNSAGWILDAFQGQSTRSGASVIYPRQAYLTLFLVFLVLSLFSFCISLRVRETHGRQAGDRSDRRDPYIAA